METAETAVENESILKRVAAGDQLAVEQCVKRYGSLIWSMARRLYYRTEDAEDVVQEIFLSIWKNAGRFDPEKARESTFIIVIARRRLIDHLRAAYRRPITEGIEDHPLPTGLSEGFLNARIDAARVTTFFKDLRPEQKEMIWMNIYEGMSHSEIASIKKMPLGTVKTHLKRGLNQMREMIVASHINRGQNVTAC